MIGATNLKDQLKYIESLGYELGPEEGFDPNNPDHLNPDLYVVIPGDAFTHTCLALDAAALRADQRGLKGDDRAILMLSALCHDFGKASHTQLGEKDGVPRITSKGHEPASVPLAKEFLESIGIKRKLIENILPLVGSHMTHLNYDPNSKRGNILQIAEEIFPATIEQLEDLVSSDSYGRDPEGRSEHGPVNTPENFLPLVDDAKKQNVYQGKPTPLIGGDDLKIFGMTQGLLLGQTLKEVYKLQLEGKVKNREDAIYAAEEIAKKKLNFINGNDVLELIGQGGPAVRTYLNDAWEAQKRGEIKTRDEALEWLKNYAGGHNEPPMEDEQIKESGLKFSELNMSYAQLQNVAEQGMSPADIILQNLKSGNPRWNELEKYFDDEEGRTIFRETQKSYAENPEFVIKTWEEIADDELAQDVLAYSKNKVLTAESTQYGDVPDQVPSGQPDYSEIINRYPGTAQEAISFVNSFMPGFLNDIVYIGVTNETSVLGVYESDLSDKIMQNQESGHNDNQTQENGIAFRISPNRIDTETQNFVQEGNNTIQEYQQINGQLPPETLNAWQRMNTEEIQIVLLGSILAHEAAHAKGGDESPAQAAEKEFSGKMIEYFNQYRADNGIPKLPITVQE